MLESLESQTRSGPSASHVGALAFVVVALVGPVCHASEGDHGLWVAPRYVGLYAAKSNNDDLHGVGLSFGYRYGLSDFFTWTAEATYGLLPTSHTVQQLGAVRVGATYTIDAVMWVPWVGLTAGAYVVPGAKRFDGGLAAGVGVDYRRWRGFSVGVDAWYHALFRHLDTIPATLTVGLRFTWYLEP